MDGQDDEHTTDPVALTLAVWLGLIVSVTGLIRLSENAAAQAQAAAQATGQATAVTTRASPSEADVQAMSMRMASFGG